MIRLRDYQKECVSVIRENFKKKDKQLIQLPTGAGKTLIFLTYLKERMARALILCPTLDLLEQVGKNAKDHLDSVYIKRKDTKYKNEETYLITSASLPKSKTFEELIKIKFDTIVIDEAHKAFCNTYMKFLSEYSKIHNKFKLLGVTATPERMDKKPLLEIFENFTYSKSIIEMIYEGYLCDVVGTKINTRNRLKTQKSTSDFKLIDLKLLDEPSRNTLIYKTYEENCYDKKTLIFCISVDHSIKIADYLKEKNISAEAIHGNMSVNERQDILRRFQQGKIQVLTNCQLLTEGFDEPSIEAIIIARPTRSKSLYCQMLGRGMRLFPGKTVCELYELTDNAHNICTFNVMADKEPDFNYEYAPKTKLTDLKEIIKNISITDYILEKKDLILFRDFNDFLGFAASDEIKLELKLKNISFFDSITFLEAKYLLWKENLKEKYGKHKL